MVLTRKAKTMFRTRVLWFLLLLLLITAVPVSSQDGSPTNPARANAYAWVELVRNGRHPEISAALISPDSYTVYNPFQPAGAPVSIDDAIAGEAAFQTAFPDMQFTHYLILAQGNYAAYVTYQEGHFQAPYFDVQPTGDYWHGPLVALLELDDGKVVGEFDAWNQQAFLQDMGWAEPTYTFDAQPWAVELGSTSTTPDQHLFMIRTVFNATASSNIQNVFPRYYDPNVVVHDYLGDLVGLDALIAHEERLQTIPGFTPIESQFVCDGDLCLAYASASADGADGPVNLLWMSLHRFVDGKIVEEWWLYDNAAMWSMLPPEM